MNLYSVGGFKIHSLCLGLKCTSHMHDDINPKACPKICPFFLLLLFFCKIKKLGEIQCVYHTDIVLALSANMWFCSIENMCVNT